jgi:hypothetical protein
MEKSPFVFAALLFVVPGCGDNGDGNGGSSGGTSSEDYASAYCAWMNECKGQPLSDCTDKLTHLTIGAAGLAVDCVTELRKLDCLNPPSQCDISDVGDADAAKAMCQNVARAQCKDAQACAGISTFDCEDEFDNQVCNYAISARASLDECVEKSQNTSCAVSAGIPECQGVIISN